MMEADIDLSMHTVIAGITNSGKTTLGKHLFARSSRYGVFVNTQGEDVPGKEVGPGMPRMADLVEHRKVVWTGTPAKMPQQLDELTARLFALGRRFAASHINRAQPWCNVFVDEAWFLEGKGKAAGALTALTAQGLRHGVVCVAMTQRPATVSHTLVMQSPQVIVFNVQPDDRAYIEERKGPMPEDVVAWIQQPHHFAVNRGTGWRKCPPVPR